MNIVVSYLHGENYSELAAITTPYLIKYCAKHNYTCNIKSLHPNNKGTYAFTKTKQAIDLLNNYEVVLMLEGDMLLTNLNFKIESLLEECKDFYCCKDVNGVNTGSFICRSTDWMKDTLNHVMTFENDLWDEQAFWETFEHEKIKYISHPSINSLPYDLYSPTYGKVGVTEPQTKPTHEEGNWQYGDFLLHLPGMELSQRINIFNEYKNKIIL